MCGTAQCRADCISVQTSHSTFPRWVASITARASSHEFSLHNVYGRVRSASCMHSAISSEIMTEVSCLSALLSITHNQLASQASRQFIVRGISHITHAPMEHPGACEIAMSTVAAMRVVTSSVAHSDGEDAISCHSKESSRMLVDLQLAMPVTRSGNSSA